MIKRFRTKPVEIDAVQFTGSNSQELESWTEGNFAHKPVKVPEIAEGIVPAVFMTCPMIYDKLHETWIKVFVGQWIVRGAKGEYYPCDDETFHWKYEEVCHTEFIEEVL